MSPEQMILLVQLLANAIRETNPHQREAYLLEAMEYIQSCQ